LSSHQKNSAHQKYRVQQKMEEYNEIYYGGLISVG